MIIPIIMAGGSGTRLWPLSRSSYPKQFLALAGEHTMFQQTIARLNGLDHAPCVFVCNEEHRFLAAEQVRQLNIEHGGILLEPMGRDTAPAIALAAFHALKDNADATLLVLAADHVIENVDAFHAAVKIAERHARNDRLVTFGIVATSPETGYGYINRGRVLDDAFEINQFVEKPDLNIAKTYVDSGEYYWNSGMFMYKASRYLEVLKQHRPEIYAVCEKAISKETNDLDFIRIDEDVFMTCPAESVDYAVMEPASSSGNGDAVVVPLDAGWSDVGSFAALWEVSELDDDGNSFIGDVKSVNTKNTLVRSDERLVATVGIENLVIIDTKDSLLIAHKDHTQDVKSIVNLLKADERPEVKLNREVYRPWGKYDSIDNGSRFQVKRITVNPGAKLSIQMHHHRAEHWVVVTGTAKVTNGDQTILLTENQSTYIPLGTIHALENPGKVPLELIEVQTGTYFGEDDIVRFEDRYGRT
ncbi:MAG: mannose-1-phosphate guanylyltransferase/mannose-6-phosphate isomerase [Alphaproteobacteria bacterium]|nr:mannose-1-phosphate guanylyltransferase/mannose-6-phosphate isomerase [Alphaproteobacteria bacterium]